MLSNLLCVNFYTPDIFFRLISVRSRIVPWEVYTQKQSIFQKQVKFIRSGADMLHRLYYYKQSIVLKVSTKLNRYFVGGINILIFLKKLTFFAPHPKMRWAILGQKRRYYQKCFWKIFLSSAHISFCHQLYEIKRLVETSFFLRGFCNYQFCKFFSLLILNTRRHLC